MCKTTLNNEEADKKIKCDLCKGCFCQKCSGLSTTEVRVMQLATRRTLKYMCMNCDGAGVTTSVQQKQIDVLSKLEQNLRNYFDNCLSSLGTTLSARLDHLTGQVDMLKRSNIQPVHLTLPSASADPACPPPLLPEIGGRQDSSYPRDGTSTEEHQQLGRHISLPSGSKSVRHSAPHSDSRGVPSGAVTDDTSPRTRVVNGRRTRSQAVIGVKCPEASTALRAAPVIRRTSVAVSRLSLQITERDLEAYLKSTFGTDKNFKIEKMTVRSGDYGCFRVETDAELLHCLLDPQNWIEGVSVRKFRFFPKFNSTKKHSTAE